MIIRETSCSNECWIAFCMRKSLMTDLGLTKLLFRRAVSFGAKTHQRYPSLSKRKIITKLTKLFGKTLYSPMSCLLYMLLILSSPIFGLGLSCLYSNSLSEPSREYPMRIPYPHLQRFAHVMTDFYHGLW